MRAFVQVPVQKSDYKFPFSVEYIVVAGGGGGGAAQGYSGGSGGAGGYRSSISGEPSGGGALAETPLTLNVETNYSLTIGAGGVRRTYPIYARGGTGSTSTFHSISSVGGGGGGGGAGGSGGSGGGGAYYRGTQYGVGSGITGQGYNGSGRQGGGAAGTNGSGITSNATGSAITFARGGDTNPAGGLRAEKGSGGNAQAGSSNPPSGGQSGAVVIKVPENITATFTAGVTSTLTNNAGYNVYYITAAGASDTVTFNG